MNNLALSVKNNNRAGQQASQGTISQSYTEVLAKRVTESRGSHNILNTLSRAETSLGKGKVVGNAHHNGVLQASRVLVELTDRSRAHASIHRGEDVQNNVLTLKRRRGHGAQVITHQGKSGSLAAYLGQLTNSLYFSTLQFSSSHTFILAPPPQFV